MIINAIQGWIYHNQEIYLAIGNIIINMVIAGILGIAVTSSAELCHKQFDDEDYIICVIAVSIISFIFISIIRLYLL